MTSVQLLAIGSILSWGGWLFVLLRFDPLLENWVSHLLFYTSFALALQGTILLVGLALWNSKTGMAASRAEASRIGRQAFLIVLFVIVTLNLAARDVLRWWNVLPLALAVLILELFFLSLQQKRTHRTSYVSAHSVRKNES